MGDLALRSPREDDWFAILELVNRSVARVAGTGLQDAWLANRRSFDRRAGVQQHWVAQDMERGEMAGYAGIERRASEPANEWRVFVVTGTARRSTLGARLLEHAMGALGALGASSARFVEHAEDSEFLAFLSQHRFAPSGRLRLASGGEAVILVKALGK